MSKPEILDFVRSYEEPVVTAGEIAGHFGKTNEAVNYHLEDLVEDGKLRRKVVGASAVVYYISG